MGDKSFETDFSNDTAMTSITGGIWQWSWTHLPFAILIYSSL